MILNMKIIKSKYTIPVLSLISIALCFFPILSAKITTGEVYTSVICGYNLLEFSAVGLVILIAPILVPTIMHGCQTKEIKEISLEILLLGNSICYTHSVHKAWQWLHEIEASLFEIKATLFLYPIAFAVLCFVAIYKNASAPQSDTTSLT